MKKDEMTRIAHREITGLGNERGLSSKVIPDNYTRDPKRRYRPD